MADNARVACLRLAGYSRRSVRSPAQTPSASYNRPSVATPAGVVKSPASSAQKVITDVVTPPLSPRSGKLIDGICATAPLRFPAAPTGSDLSPAFFVRRGNVEHFPYSTTPGKTGLASWQRHNRHRGPHGRAWPSRCPSGIAKLSRSLAGERLAHPRVTPSPGDASSCFSIS